MQIYSFNDLKFTLKHLKLSYMFRSYDHPKEHTLFLAKIIVQKHSVIYIVTLQFGIPNCIRLTQYTRHAAITPTQRNDVNHWVFLNYNFSKEQCMSPAVSIIILTYLVPVLFTFYIQGVLKLKKNNSGAKMLNEYMWICWCIN